MTKTCWKCHREVEEPIRFKSICEQCFSYLHCCVGCQYYEVGKPNHCLIPGTDPIRDREANNYCEEFNALSDIKKSQAPSVEDVSKKLFKDD